MKRTLNIVFVIAAASGLAGCQTVEEILSGAPRPDAEIRAVRLQGLSLEDVTLDFDVAVSNPYGVPLPILDVVYGLSVEDRRFLTGTFTEGATIPAGEEVTFTLPATVRFSDLIAAVSGVRPGAVVPYTADLEVAVNAPGGQVVKLPLRKEGELPVPQAPAVELHKVTWDRLTMNEATAVLSVGIGNTNEFAVDLLEFDYGLAFAGRRIINSSIDRSVSAEAGEEIVLDIPISIRPSDLGLAALEVLRGDDASYELEGIMQLGTPFGPLAAPFERSGRTPFER
jgi:LEA14-like dessication related protein